MATHLQANSEPSISGLVTGIVNDAQALIKQQLELFKHEIKDDFQKTKEAALTLGLGTGILFMGGLLFCLMFVHLLHWAVPVLTLWGSYGVVGLLFVIAGGALFYAGKKKLKSLQPPGQSVKALKENVLWIKNPK